jgi:hypothetical protein
MKHISDISTQNLCLKLDFIAKNFIDDVIDSYNVYFIGTNAQQEEINIKLSEIIFFIN